MLHIVHLNDTESLSMQGWARVATVIRTLREQGKCDLLLHAGDVRLGAPTSSEAVSILNQLHFDALTPGNHDLDYGVESLKSQIAALEAVVLCANVRGCPEWRPFVLLERGGCLIAVCGVTLESMALFQPDRNLTGVTFHGAGEALKELVQSIRPRVDLLIVLSHCGLETDRELARSVPGIDLIVGGHSHDLLSSPERVGQTAIVQAGCYGDHVGLVTVESGKQGLQVKGTMLPTGTVPPDPALRWKEPSPDKELIGYMEGEQPSSSTLWETGLGNMTADLIRQYAETDVALVRCASVGPAARGPIYRGDVGKLNYTAEDRIARLTLTGAELVLALELGARDAYYLLGTSNAKVVYDGERPVGARVQTVEIDGRPVDPQRTYSVACSEILARGAAGFTCLIGKPYELLSETIGQLLERRIRSAGIIAPAVDGRLVVHGAIPRAPKR